MREHAEAVSVANVVGRRRRRQRSLLVFIIMVHRVLSSTDAGLRFDYDCYYVALRLYCNSYVVGGVCSSVRAHALIPHFFRESRVDDRSSGAVAMAATYAWVGRNGLSSLDLTTT